MERLSDSFSDHLPQQHESDIFIEMVNNSANTVAAGKKPKQKPAVAVRRLVRP